MIDEIVSSIIDVFTGLAANPIQAAIVAVILIAFGFLMPKWGQLMTFTVGALALYVVAQVVIMVVNGSGAVPAVESLWNSSGFTTVRVVIVYFFAFALGIAIFHAASGAMRRS